MTKDNAHDLKSPKALPIGEIIENRKFRVPMYQRNYKWRKDIAEKLAQDLIESYQKSIKEKTTITKSIGLLTLHRSMDSEFLDIIDGQQRFITLSIIFNVLCDEEMPIELSFERDGEDRARFNAIHKKYASGWCGSSSDVDRIMRNKERIKECLGDIKKEDFKEYILKNCVMLCSIVEADPEKEFMNLNAYKTKFSVCDYVRSNLISLNSFYREDLDKKNSIIASCLEKHSYKTAIAHLYDDILDIFKYEPIASGTYKDVFSVVKGQYFDPDDTKESRINILFSKELSYAGKGYFSDEINKDVEEWIQILLKVACAKKLMAQLEQEMEGHNFSSAKEIDDYQKLKRKNFLDLIMNLNKKEEENESIDTITLAKILKKNSNVGYVLMKELGKDDLKLANRYFESFVYSGINRATITAAEVEYDPIELPKMSDGEIISCIQGAGQYVIDRFLHEQQQALDASVVIAPVLDLEDRENLDFGEELDTEEGDTIAVKELFDHKIKVPVIQRDYCMGARISEKEEADDFLGYLISNFQEGKEIVASTILISVAKADKDEKDIYIFDGQQRVYTIYQLLKYCDGKCDDGDDRFTFVGRKNGASVYSKTAVTNLRKAFDNRKKNVNIQEFREYLRNKVKFKLKVTETVSDAEQFFMDINGGVSLKNYEIFKSCLCERLVKLKRTDFIKEMENKWLVWFYKFCDIQKDDETDIEELMEMRFIEFLCRFFIMEARERMQEDNNKNNEKLPAFDGIDSKSELVGKLEYLKNLREEDISNIKKVMDYLVNHEEEIKKPSDRLNIELYYTFNNSSDNSPDDWPDIYLGSTVSKQRIGYYLLEQCEVQKEKFIDKHKDYILHMFIDSLSDKTRKLLKTIYSWKNEGDLIEIYDADLLIRDCILHIVGRKAGEGKYPYAEKKDIVMNFLGGYQVVKRKLEGIPEEEVPAYYYAEIRENPVPQDRNYIRAKYLYDQVIDENPARRNQTKLNFIWRKKSGKSIKKGDGVETYIVLLNISEDCTPEVRDMMEFGVNTPTIFLDQTPVVRLTNRTDAYFLNSDDAKKLI